MSNLLEKQNVRNQLSYFLVHEAYEQGRGYDIQQVFEKIKDVQSAIDKRQNYIMLTDMNLWSHAISTLETIVYEETEYRYNKTLSESFGEYVVVYTMHKTVDYSSEGTLKIFLHFSDYIEKYSIAYDDYIEFMKEHIANFYIFDEIKLDEDEGSEFYENMEEFFTPLIEKAFKPSEQ